MVGDTVKRTLAGDKHWLQVAVHVALNFTSANIIFNYALNPPVFRWGSRETGDEHTLYFLTDGVDVVYIRYFGYRVYDGEYSPGYWQVNRWDTDAKQWIYVTLTGVRHYDPAAAAWEAMMAYVKPFYGKACEKINYLNETQLRQCGLYTEDIQNGETIG